MNEQKTAVKEPLLITEESKFLVGDLSGIRLRQKLLKIPKRVVRDNGNHFVQAQELEEARGEIDEIVDTIGKLIINIACDNDDFTCSTCLGTASTLYGIMRKHAREEDANNIYDRFAEITGRDITDY